MKLRKCFHLNVSSERREKQLVTAHSMISNSAFCTSMSFHRRFPPGFTVIITPAYSVGEWCHHFRYIIRRVSLMSFVSSREK